MFQMQAKIIVMAKFFNRSSQLTHMLINGVCTSQHFLQINIRFIAGFASFSPLGLLTLLFLEPDNVGTPFILMNAFFEELLTKKKLRSL